MRLLLFVSPSPSPSCYWMLAVIYSCLPLLVLGTGRGLGDDSTTSTSTSTSSTNENENESSSSSYDIYKVLNVRPPSACRVPRWKRWSWKLHSRLLPLLHVGTLPPEDVFVNLRVLWNKALASVADPKSPAHEADDHFPTYHLLPRLSRWILFRAIPVGMYPRWFHANIELRTAYLNRALKDEIEHVLQTTNKTSIELVILGGGYDTRSIRTLYRYPRTVIRRVWELDFESVVASKQRLLESSLYRQVPQLASSCRESLRFRGVNLNQLEEVDSALAQIHQEQQQDEGDTRHHTIILTEAVLMYLDDGIPLQILQRCVDRFGASHVSWIFVDRLRDLPEDDFSPSSIANNDDLLSSRKVATDYLASLIGWQVVDWWIKPGATRHMGVARPIISNQKTI
jgi:hypothetical protein